MLKRNSFYMQNLAESRSQMHGRERQLKRNIFHIVNIIFNSMQFKI